MRPVTGDLVIDGCRYVPDWSLFTRSPLESDVQILDAGAEPSERSLSRFGWKRTQTDFVLGAGQEWFDQEDENERRRFFRSRNLTMRDRGQLVSTRRVERESLRLDKGGRLLSAGRRVYWYLPGQIRQIVKRGAGVRTVTGLPSNVIINDADYASGLLYIATATGVYRQAATGSDAVGRWSNRETTHLIEGASRLLGTHRNELWEFDSVGGRLGDRNIWLHTDINFMWRGGANAPNGVYVWGDDGTKTEIFLLVATDATGEFAAPFSVASWPVGELVNDMVEYGGIIVLATERGIRLATISGSGFLSYGPVLEFDGGVTRLNTRGEDVFFPLNNHEVAGTMFSGVGRLGLSRFTTTLVPSWEFHVDNNNNDPVTDVATIHTDTGTPLLLYLQDTDTAGEVRFEEAGVFHDQVAFDSGKVTYGTPEPKAFLSVELEGTFDKFTSLDVAVYVDRIKHPLTVNIDGRLARCTTADQLVGNELRLVFQGRINDQRSQFELTRWTMRAFALPEQVEVIEVGTILETHATTGSVESHDPYGDWLRLQALADTHKICELKCGDRTDRGYVDAVLVTDGRIKDVLGSGRSGEFVQGTWVVRFIAANNA